MNDKVIGWATEIPKIETVILDRVWTAIDTIFSKQTFVKDVKFDLFEDAIASNITARFAALIHGVVKNDCEKEDVPLNSWEHFKLDFFPQILLKYYPVKTRTIMKSWDKIIVCNCNNNEKCLVLKYALEKKTLNENSDKEEQA